MSVKKQISKDDLENLSKLAMLNLSDEEKEKLIPQLNEIIKYFKKLNDLDTKNIQPITHPIEGLKNVFRKDVPKESLSTEEALKNAQHKKEGYFKAPRILKE
jgi:aspartyl-tRNA(Asn)/glutamyl-tRNA(Gln) amidotransferase subunit C